MTLAEAAGRGHLDLVRARLSQGADPRARLPDGTRALDWAAQEGHREIVEILLAHDPALLDLPGLEDRTALMAAAGSGHAALVSLLLARGADPRTRGEGGGRALDWAAQDGREDIVALLLAHDPALADLPGEDGHTALILAAGHGHVSLIHRLLAHGADPRRRVEDGTRALDWAAQEDHQPAVESLLAYDAGLLDLPGCQGRTALAAAAGSGHTALVDRLLARGADPRLQVEDGARPLDRAAEEGHLAVVERLLARDPDLLDLPGAGGQTALMAAAGHGHATLVGLLLARGADPRRQLPDGEHALDWAAQEGRLESVERLLAHDPRLLDLPGYEGRTGLAAAAGGGHAVLTDALLARGADPRARLADGSRPLDWAAQKGHGEVVERLLAHDPGLLDLPGQRERTALAAAAGSGRTALVERLLALGADPRRVDADGFSALEWAAHGGHLAALERMLEADPRLLHEPDTGECCALLAAAHGGQAHVVRALLARGADPRRRGPDGSSALGLAAGRGHEDVVVLLLNFDSGLVHHR